MYHVEIYVRVRRACMVEGMSVREASRVFGLHRDTVRKMLAYSAPPGYRRQDPPRPGALFRRPRLEPFTGVIDAILEADRQVPRKQRHTAKRIFERLSEKTDLPDPSSGSKSKAVSAASTCSWCGPRHLQAVSATDFPFSGSSYHSCYHFGSSRYQFQTSLLLRLHRSIPPL